MTEWRGEDSGTSLGKRGTAFAALGIRMSWAHAATCSLGLLLSADPKYGSDRDLALKLSSLSLGQKTSQSWSYNTSGTVKELWVRLAHWSVGFFWQQIPTGV